MVLFQSFPVEVCIKRLLNHPCVFLQIVLCFRFVVVRSQEPQMQVAGPSIGAPNPYRFCSGERLSYGRWIKPRGLWSNPQIHLLFLGLLAHFCCSLSTGHRGALLLFGAQFLPQAHLLRSGSPAFCS